MHRLVTFLAAAVAAALMLTAAPAPATANGARPVIGDVPVFDAPINGSGGIQTPYVGCTNWRVEPRVTSVITRIGYKGRRVYRWHGAYPAAGFPRVPVGDYRVRTEAVCRGNKGIRTESVTVKEKTHQRTVSKREWWRIKQGMTVSQVTRIVGYRGIASPLYDGKVSRTYDIMKFWAWSILEFRNGRVVRKFWDTDHD